MCTSDAVLRDIAVQKKFGDDISVLAGHPQAAFILEYLAECDRDFYEPLSSRVNLEEFSQKLSQLSTTFVLYKHGVIAGLVCAYFYQPDSHKGFITLVHTKQEFRGQHLASLLVETVKEYAQSQNFATIELFVSKQQTSAFQLYLRHGFAIVSEEPSGRCQMKCDL